MHAAIVPQFNNSCHHLNNPASSYFINQLGAGFEVACEPRSRATLNNLAVSQIVKTRL
jgi:hypothetical protein